MAVTTYRPLSIGGSGRLTPLGRRPRPGADLDHLAAIRAWTRSRFALADDAFVTIAQVRCLIEGCPPDETMIGFWSEDGRHHRTRLLKSIAEVERADIAWLIGSPGDHEGGAWDCC